MNIQWYPGHMTKTKRMISDSLRQVDVVCEILDARIPYSSGNPDVRVQTEGKPRLVILNRVDQADPAVTALWTQWFREQGIPVLETDCKSGSGINRFAPAVRQLIADKLDRYAEKGQTGRTVRVMIVGIPNVGKSSFINRIAGRKSAKVEDRPGVTRGKQWVAVEQGLDLLDTPGILWPKFEDQRVGLNLAFTGAVKDAVMDVETLSFQLMERLMQCYPAVLKARYKLEVSADMPGHELLERAARGRGFLISGGQTDTERMAKILLDEFRGGVLGRITLERPEDMKEETEHDTTESLDN